MSQLAEQLETHIRNGAYQEVAPLLEHAELEVSEFTGVLPPLHCIACLPLALL